MAGTKITQYAIARGDKVLSNLHATPDTAVAELGYFEDRMRELGLEPDVQVVSIDTTTTTSKPKPYRAPVTEDETPDATSDTED